MTKVGGADASGKEGGAAGSVVGVTSSDDFPVGTRLEVLLDTGEWCPAMISASRNKNLKYEVMFGGDEGDKARLPVPTDRACLAEGTVVEVRLRACMLCCAVAYVVATKWAAAFCCADGHRNAPCSADVPECD